MKLLTDKTFATKTNNWYAPTKELEEKYLSVVAVSLKNMTSSAGDWSGFIIQKVGKNTFIAIGFSQYNNHPHDGFTLYTCEHPFYKGRFDEANWVENVRSCWEQFAGLE